MWDQGQGLWQVRQYLYGYALFAFESWYSGGNTYLFGIQKKNRNQKKKIFFLSQIIGTLLRQNEHKTKSPKQGVIITDLEIRYCHLF